MFKAPVGYLQLMFSRCSCFDKMQNPVSLWDKFGFSAGAKEGKSYICHMAPIHSHSEHYENEGGMVCLRKLSPQQNLSTCILSLFISNCVGGKNSFSCAATPFILVSVWWADQISSLLPLWCTSGFRIFGCLISTCPHICALCKAVVKYHLCNPFCSLVHCVFMNFDPAESPAEPLQSTHTWEQMTFWTVVAVGWTSVHPRSRTHCSWLLK